MTSGGKGLHVLEYGSGQERVHKFAHQIVQEIANRSPELITIEMSTSKRRGRVFADWLRNAFGQTIVAPYSVRFHPGTPILTPLDWDEVVLNLEPLRFNLLSIERRLEAKDPHGDF